MANAKCKCKEQEKYFFSFFLYQFQSNNYAIFHNAIYVRAKMENVSTQLNFYITDKKKNARSKVTFLLRA